MLEEAVATLFDDSVLLEMKLYIISGNHEKYVLLFNFECLGTVHKWRHSPGGPGQGLIY